MTRSTNETVLDCDPGPLDAEVFTGTVLESATEAVSA